MLDTIPTPNDYVIQRASETLCEWWTGSGWSEHPENARHYDVKPDASVETGDESAKAEPLGTPTSGAQMEP